MTPVEITPSAGAAPGLLGADVPWPRRPEEFARETTQLADRLAHMTAGPPRAAADLTGGERYVLGVRAAARWTSGELARAPMAREDLPVTGEQIRAELAAAEVLMRSRGAGWEFATGVLRWLLWATGAEDEMAYPEA